jgi:hypothetical protein
MNILTSIYEAQYKEAKSALRHQRMMQDCEKHFWNDQLHKAVKKLKFYGWSDKQIWKLND